MHYLVRHRYPSIERRCLLWCGMCTGDCVFGLGHASVRSVKFVDRAGGGLILLLQVGCEKGVKDCIGKDVLAIV